VELCVRRLASFVVCLAFVCGIDPAGVRGDRSAHDGRGALTFHRPAAAPLELATGRLSPLLLASAQQVPSHEFHSAVGGARSGITVAGRWTRLARPSTCVAPFPTVQAHVDRGPPRTVLS